MYDDAKIVSRYRQANEEKRLYLYLDCPELRDEFIRIDRGEAAAMRATPQSGPGSLDARAKKRFSWILLPFRMKKGPC